MKIEKSKSAAVFSFKLKAMIFAVSAVAFVALGFAVEDKIETIEAVNMNDESTMVMIREGTFIMGDNYGEADEQPARTVRQKTYWLDKYEVTYGQYRKCYTAGVCQPPADFDRTPNNNQPIVGVSWQDALEYCVWAHERLPSEAEWEKAARGPRGLKYPWGDVLDCTYANYRECGIGRALTIGSYPKGVSPYSIMDMAGNAFEWVSDYYYADYYKLGTSVNPRGPAAGKYRVARGGSFARYAGGMRSADRAGFKQDTRSDDIGFRCAADTIPEFRGK